MIERHFNGVATWEQTTWYHHVAQQPQQIQVVATWDLIILLNFLNFHELKIGGSLKNIPLSADVVRSP